MSKYTEVVGEAAYVGSIEEDANNVYFNIVSSYSVHGGKGERCKVSKKNLDQMIKDFHEEEYFTEIHRLKEYV